MKVLFAVSNENISESIVKKYQREYREIISYKNVYYFNAILKELQKDKSYDRIVISEELEPFSNNNYEAIDKFIFEKLDSISDEASNSNGNDTPIILICTDRRAKSDSILVKLFGIGIYNAIIGRDRSTDEVCRLLNKPRTKKEAKIYYRIESENVNYQAESENDVSEVEIQNILAHYKRLGKNEEKFAQSFDNIAAQYSDTQLRLISNFLPLNVRAVLEETSPKYQQIMTFKSTPAAYQKQNKKKKEVDGIRINSIGDASQPRKLSKPVVIPSAVNTKNVKKLIKQDQETSEQMDNIMENKENRQVEQNTIQVAEPVKRGRGRPRKTENINKTSEEKTVKRGRGRPRKNPEENSNSVSNFKNTDKKEDTLPGFDELDKDEDILPGFNDIDEDKDILPGFNDIDEDKDILPGFDNIDDDEDVLPGFDDIDEEEDVLPGFDDIDDEEDVLPGFDDKDDKEDTLPGFDDEDEEDTLPGFDDEDEEDVLPGFDDIEDKEDILSGFDDEDDEEDVLPGFDDTDDQNDLNISNNKNEYNQYTTQLDNLLTRDKKLVAFVGTSKNGTSFLVNNLAQLLSTEMGIRTAILDLTKNKNSYYIYTKNEEELRKVAFNSIQNLKSGITSGIRVNKNLSVFTSVPGEEKSNTNCADILATLVNNYSLVLLDCDFNTNPEYFARVQETYLVQTMDVLTIQPLTAFLRDLKAKNILSPENLRIVVNKETKVKTITPKVIIGGMAFYNDPAMSFMTELFNKDIIKYCTIPFEEQTYAKYLEGLVNCEISLKGYSKNFIQSLRELGNMVYPLIGGKQPYKPNNYSNNFSNQMNKTLDQMKRNY